jgi:putative DNA primase/helicase
MRQKMDKSNIYSFSKIKNLSPKEAAFKYAEMGLSVFPVHVVDQKTGLCSCNNLTCGAKGKHPREIEGGYKAATTDLNIINSWWTKHPDSNIGISGVGSGLIFVDIDPRHNGFESLAALEKEHGKLPETLTAITSIQAGVKGNHFYFRAPPGELSLKANIAEGIDIKYLGYVVAPPSIHPSGIQYEFKDGCNNIADLPDWIFELAKSKKSTVKKSDIQQISTFSNKGTFTDTYGLRVTDWLMPDNAVQKGDNIIGTHPIHGSTTGSNLSINVKDNTWYCFRCGAGGSGADAYAVAKGIIDCRDAGCGAFDDTDTAARMIESLKADGYKISDDLIEEGNLISEEFLQSFLKNAPKQKEPVKLENNFWRLPGIGGELQDIYMKTAPVPNLKYAWVAALSIISVVCSRKYTTVRRNYSSLYFIVLGDSSTGKTYISTFISKVLSQCGMSKLWSGDGGFATEQGAFSALKKTPSLVTTIDEAGHSRLAGKDSAFQISAKAAAMKIFSQCDGEFGLPKISMRSRTSKEREDLEKYNSPVKKPGLTCIEMSTAETFMPTINVRNVESGELGRYLIVQSDEFPYPNPDDILEEVVIPASIRSALRNLRYGNHAYISDAKIREYAEKNIWDAYNCQDADEIDFSELLQPSQAAIDMEYERLKNDQKWIEGYPDDPNMPPETIKYQWEYSEMYKELFEKEHIKILNKYHGKTAVHTKAMETAAKLSLVYSIMAGYEYVSKKCALKAIKVVKTLMKQIDDDFMPNVGDNECIRVTQQICKIIKAAGPDGATQSDWRNLRAWRNLGKPARADVKEMLNDYGIYQVQREKELGGAKYILYIHPDCMVNE